MKKILIVTEQPVNVVKSIKPKYPFNMNIVRCKGIKRCWGHLNKSHPFCHEENNVLTYKKTQFLKTMAYILKYLKKKNMNYYWTHYVKCEGNFKKSNNNNFDINDCADKWINKEVKAYEPNIIFSFGLYPSSYLLGKPVDKLYKYFRRYELAYKYGFKYQTRIPLIIFPHPSGANKTFNEWRKNGYKKLRYVIRESLRIL